MFAKLTTSTRGSGNESDFKTTFINVYQVTSLRPFTAGASGGEIRAESVVTLSGGTTFYARETFENATEQLIAKTTNLNSQD